MSDSEDDDKLRTLYVGNLSHNVNEEILYELFLQGGPVEDVRIIKDQNGRGRGYGFVTYVHKCSIPYSVQLFMNTKLYDKELTIRPSQRNNSNNTNSSNRGNDYNNSPQHQLIPGHPLNPFNMPTNFNSQLQGFSSMYSTMQMQMQPTVPMLVPEMGLLTNSNPLLNQNLAFLESLGAQMLLTNASLPTGGERDNYSQRDLQKHGGRDRWRRDEKPYSHHDRRRDDNRERDNRHQQSKRDHKHHDRHDNRRRR